MCFKDDPGVVRYRSGQRLRLGAIVVEDRTGSEINARLVDQPAQAVIVRAETPEQLASWLRGAQASGWGLPSATMVCSSGGCPSIVVVIFTVLGPSRLTQTRGAGRSTQVDDAG